MEVKKLDVQDVIVLIVAIFALAISKKVFKFPECYWPYRIYVLVVVALWGVYSFLSRHP